MNPLSPNQVEKPSSYGLQSTFVFHQSLSLARGELADFRGVSLPRSPRFLKSFRRPLIRTEMDEGLALGVTGDLGELMLKPAQLKRSAHFRLGLQEQIVSDHLALLNINGLLS